RRKILHRAAGSRVALLLASQEARPAVAVDRLAFGISPDRLPGFDRSLTDRTGQRRALRVRDAAVLTERHILADLDRDPADCTAGKLNHPRTLRFVINYNLVTGVPTLAPASTLE